MVMYRSLFAVQGFIPMSVFFVVRSLLSPFGQKISLFIRLFRRRQF